MSGKQKKNDEELIQNITKQFDNLNPNELKEDIEKSRKLKESKDSNNEMTNFAKSFISKYSNSKLTMEVFKKIQAAAKQVLVEQKLDAIVDYRVIFVGGVDISDLVIQKLRSGQY